jgi:hypothetical protein
MRIPTEPVESRWRQSGAVPARSLGSGHRPFRNEVFDAHSARDLCFLKMELPAELLTRTTHAGRTAVELAAELIPSPPSKSFCCNEWVG